MALWGELSCETLASCTLHAPRLTGARPIGPAAIRFLGDRIIVSALTGSSILVTGGTGSFGKAFIRYALDNLDPRRIVILSRDELKQYEVRQLFDNDPRLRWFIGDIRDERRLERAMHGVDFVVHAAALKQVAVSYTHLTLPTKRIV